MLLLEYAPHLLLTALVSALLVALSFFLAHLVKPRQSGDEGSCRVDLLAEYGRAWSVHQLIPFADKLFLGGYGQAMDNRMLIPWEKGFSDWYLRLPLVVAAALWPSPLTLLVAHIVNIVSWAAWMPAVWDHMVWAALTEVVFVLAALVGGGRTDIAQRFFPAARAMLVVLYFSAAFWKLTTSWYEHYSSCAPVLLSELLAGCFSPHILPAGGILANTLLYTAPVFVAALEFAVAVSFLLRPDVGVLLALTFHQTINLMPMTYAGGFSSAMCCRFVLFLPGALTTSLQVQGPWVLPSAIVTVLGALMAAIHKGVDSACIAYLVLTFLYLRALMCSGLGGLAKQKPAKWLRFVAVLLAFAYGFLTPILGIQAMASSTMYANLKQFGGGNHLLVPTGLLQEHYATATGPPWAVDAFGGGLVRVDNTTSSVMQELSPAESTAQLPEHARALLRGVGASARYFELYAARNYFDRNGDLNASALHNRGVDIATSKRFDDPPYAQPAYELRRVLALARALGEGFSVTYTHLPWKGTPGEYRAYQGPQVILQEDPAVGMRSCMVGSVPCDPSEIALQSPPPRWLTWIFHPYPMPLLEGDTTEVHCST